MNLRYVILSADSESHYIEYWPIVSRMWKEVCGYEPVLACIGRRSDPGMEQHGRVIHLEDLSDRTDFTSGNLAQCARMYLAGQLDDICLISDIDMLPLQRPYFAKGIKDVPEDTLVIYSADAYPERFQQYPMCYNAAHSRVFQELLGTQQSWPSYIEQLQTWVRHRELPAHARKRPLWYVDELWFWARVQENRIPTRILHRGFSPEPADRIDRAHLSYDPEALQRGDYVDFHGPHPYSDHQNLIDGIAEQTLQRIKATGQTASGRAVSELRKWLPFRFPYLGKRHHRL